MIGSVGSEESWGEWRRCTNADPNPKPNGLPATYVEHQTSYGIVLTLENPENRCDDCGAPCGGLAI